MSQQIFIPTRGDVVAERYRIVGELGRGAYGVVYRAETVDEGRDIALKTLLPQSVLDEEVTERFEREAMVVSRLRHRNIIDVYDYGSQGGLLYMAMEFVEGRRLGDLIAEESPMAPEQVLPLALQILDALSFAHAEGVVHRDLKPDNILLLRPDPEAGVHEETVKILDFGIAKVVQEHRDSDTFKTLTQAGDVLGTPHYMSPEAIAGDEVTHRADLYAFGVLMYEMLTGEQPFDAPNSTAVLVRHLRDDPPELPEPLASSVWGAAVRRSLVKQPDDRIGSAAELEELLVGQAPPPGLGAPGSGARSAAPAGGGARAADSSADATQKSGASSRGLRHPVALAIALLALVLAVTGAVAGVWFATTGEREPDPGLVREVPPPPAPPASPERALADEQRSGAATLAEADAHAASNRVAASARQVALSRSRLAVKSEANPVDGDATPTRVREPDERSAKTRTRIRATQPPRERRKQEAGTVEISLESTPSNAHVHLDGVHIGETPLTHRLDRGEAKHRLRFSRFGYRTESVTLVPSADRDVRVRLERKRLQLGP